MMDPMMDLPRLQHSFLTGHKLGGHIVDHGHGPMHVSAEEPADYADRRRHDPWHEDAESDRRGSRPIMKMTASAYRQLMQHLDELPFRCEKAGILIGPEDEEDLVTHFQPDLGGQARPASFTLNHEALNGHLARIKDAGLTCVGIAHAHPPGITRPSGGDLDYLARLFGNPKNDAPFVIFPIVANGKLYPFIVEPGPICRVAVANLIVV